MCLQVTNSFSAATGVQTTPGMPLELTVDVVDGPTQPSDVAAFGLGRGWWLLGALSSPASSPVSPWGWLSRWRVAVWRTN